MGAALFLFVFSLIAIVALLFSGLVFKKKKSFFKKSDAHILNWMKKGKTFISFFNKKTFKLFLHFALEETEGFLSKVFRRLKSLVRKP